MKEALLRPTEAARLLGVSLRSLYDLAEPRGQIPCSRCSPRGMVFKRSDIEAYKVSRRVTRPAIEAPPPMDDEQVTLLEHARALALRICGEVIGAKPDRFYDLARWGIEDSVADALKSFYPSLPMPNAQGHYRYGDLFTWAKQIYADRAKRDGPTSLYRHFDAAGRLLYVGIAFDVLARTRQHEGSYWASQVARITHETYADRQTALIAEKAAIRLEDPVHNIRR